MGCGEITPPRGEGVSAIAFHLGASLPSYQPGARRTASAACWAWSKEALSKTRLAGWDLGRDPWLPEAMPPDLLLPGALWIGKAGEVVPDKQGVLPSSLWQALCSVCSVDPQGPRWLASPQQATLQAVLPRLSHGQDPGARCLQGVGVGLARQQSITQPHRSRRQGNPAAGFLFSLPVLMSAISMENVNLSGSGPNTGDAIVLASAPASGDLARLPFLLAPTGLGTAIREPQPSHLPGLGHGPWGVPGLACPPTPFQMLPPYASKQLSHLCPSLTNSTSPEGRKGGRGREGCNHILCACGKMYTMILAVFK